MMEFLNNLIEEEYEKVAKKVADNLVKQRVTHTPPDVDQVALECMQRIMYILDANWTDDRKPQLKAQIQCAVIDALENFK